MGVMAKEVGLSAMIQSPQNMCSSLFDRSEVSWGWGQVLMLVQWLTECLSWVVKVGMVLITRCHYLLLGTVQQGWDCYFCEWVLGVE